MITKRAILALLMFVSSISANAQVIFKGRGFTCTVPDTNVVCNTNSTCIVECTITNTSCCSNLNCKQVIDSIFALPLGWYVAMCNPNGCLPSTITESNFIIPPAESFVVTFVIHANGNTGDIHFKVKFIDDANRKNFVAFPIHGAISTGMTPDRSSTTFLSQNFPNPFSTFSTIQYNIGSSNGQLIITDMQGKIIKEYKLNTPSGEIIVTDKLQAGMYFYALYRDNILISKNKMVVH